MKKVNHGSKIWRNFFDSTLFKIYYKINFIIILIFLIILNLNFKIFSQTDVEGSHLDIYLVIDCSKSVWPSEDQEFISNYFKLILQKIKENLREYTRFPNDRLAINIFANAAVQVLNLEFVGNREASLNSINDLFISIATKKIPELNLLDVKKTNLEVCLHQQFRYIENLHQEYKSQNNNSFLLNRNEVIVIITDGINDPNNENDKAIIELLEQKKIKSIIANLKNFLNIKVAMIQIPVSLNDPDLLYYNFHSDWREIIEGLHYAPIRFQDLEGNISELFNELRKFKKIKLCSSANEFKIDRENNLKGIINLFIQNYERERLFFPRNNLPIIIELERLVFPDERDFIISQLDIPYKENKKINLTDNLEFGKAKEILLDIKLPLAINPRPGSVGKIKFNFKIDRNNLPIDLQQFTFLQDSCCQESQVYKGFTNFITVKVKFNYIKYFYFVVYFLFGIILLFCAASYLRRNFGYLNYLQTINVRIFKEESTAGIRNYIFQLKEKPFTRKLKIAPQIINDNSWFFYITPAGRDEILFEEGRHFKKTRTKTEWTKSCYLVDSNRKKFIDKDKHKYLVEKKKISHIRGGGGNYNLQIYLQTDKPTKYHKIDVNITDNQNKKGVLKKFAALINNGLNYGIDKISPIEKFTIFLLCFMLLLILAIIILDKKYLLIIIPAISILFFILRGLNINPQQILIDMGIKIYEFFRDIFKTNP